MGSLNFTSSLHTTSILSHSRSTPSLARLRRCFSNPQSINRSLSISAVLSTKQEVSGGSRGWIEIGVEAANPNFSFKAYMLDKADKVNQALNDAVSLREQLKIHEAMRGLDPVQPKPFAAI